MQIKNLEGRVLREVPGDSLKGADLSGKSLNGADLRKADLRGADLRKVGLSWADLRRANLSWADLTWADLRGAHLHDVNIRWADLRNANLRGADLRGANLRKADLRGADLRKADLSWADLRGANLSWADLTWADLRWADLSWAYLTGAHIEGAVLPLPIVPSEGDFLGYKKVIQADGSYAVITLRIPADAQRTSALTSLKCRASHVVVVNGEGVSPTNSRGKLRYTPGAVVTADRFNPDRREECTNGVHFFLTFEEAEKYRPWHET